MLHPHRSCSNHSQVPSEAVLDMFSMSIAICIGSRSTPRFVRVVSPGPDRCTSHPAADPGIIAGDTVVAPRSAGILRFCRWRRRCLIKISANVTESTSPLWGTPYLIVVCPTSMALGMSPFVLGSTGGSLSQRMGNTRKRFGCPDVRRPAQRLRPGKLGGYWMFPGGIIGYR